MNPFANMPAPPIVTRDINRIGLAYQIRPSIGPAPVQPMDSATAGQLARGYEVVHMLPWTPHSYPSVGREPAMFLPPDVPATPAVQGQGSQHRGRKAQLGRVVSSGTPTSSPGRVSSSSG